MKTVKQDKLRCYVGCTYNDNTPYSFCLMPDSGSPTIEKYDSESVRFQDKDIESLLTFEQMTELKKLANTLAYKVSNKEIEEPPYMVVRHNYYWMEFEFTTSVSVPEHTSLDGKTVIKISSENIKKFLDDLRKKKQTDLEELEKKFLFYFGGGEEQA